MKSISEYKEQALGSLRYKWSPAVVGSLAYFLCVGLVSFVSEIAISRAGVYYSFFTFIPVFFIYMPLAYGYMNAIREYYLNSNAEVARNVFRMPLRFYMDVVWTMFYMCVKIFLWSLLFLIPGIVKSFSYAMTPFVLHDEPDLNAGEAIAKSARMMRGHKMDIFLLELSFIGWFILGALSCGIAYFWIFPYYTATIAAFYEGLKQDFADRESR